MGKAKTKENTCSKKPSANQSAEQKTGGKKRRKIQSKKPSSNAAKLPSSKNEYSANWKQLLKTIQVEPKPPGKKTFRPKPVSTAACGTTKKSTVASSPETKKPEIWFDDVDPDLLDPEDRPEAAGTLPLVAASSSNEMVDASGNTSFLVKEQSFKGLTKAIGIDCEMVGVGYKGEESILARVSIVNHFGHCVYDKYVKPREKVTDYRTRVSGIRPADIVNGEDFQNVQKEVSDIFNGRILVGHSIKNDLKVLFLTHPRKMIRDTSLYKPFRALFGGKTPGLKKLTARLLGVSVQEGEHSSVQDAQATMRLYTMFKRDWEKEIINQRHRAASSAVTSSQTNPPTTTNTTTLKSQVQSKQWPTHPGASLGPRAGGKPEYVDSD